MHEAQKARPKKSKKSSKQTTKTKERQDDIDLSQYWQENEATGFRELDPEYNKALDPNKPTIDTHKLDDRKWMLLINGQPQSKIYRTKKAALSAGKEIQSGKKKAETGKKGPSLSGEKTNKFSKVGPNNFEYRTDDGALYTLEKGPGRSNWIVKQFNSGDSKGSPDETYKTSALPKGKEVIQSLAAGEAPPEEAISQKGKEDETKSKATSKTSSDAQKKLFKDKLYSPDAKDWIKKMLVRLGGENVKPPEKPGRNASSEEMKRYEEELSDYEAKKDDLEHTRGMVKKGEMITPMNFLWNAFKTYVANKKYKELKEMPYIDMVEYLAKNIKKNLERKGWQDKHKKEYEVVSKVLDYINNNTGLIDREKLRREKEALEQEKAMKERKEKEEDREKRNKNITSFIQSANKKLGKLPEVEEKIQELEAQGDEESEEYSKLLDQREELHNLQKDLKSAEKEKEERDPYLNKIKEIKKELKKIAKNEGTNSQAYRNLSQELSKTEKELKDLDTKGEFAFKQLTASDFEDGVFTDPKTDEETSISDIFMGRETETPEEFEKRLYSDDYGQDTEEYSGEDFNNVMDVLDNLDVETSDIKHSNADEESIINNNKDEFTSHMNKMIDWLNEKIRLGVKVPSSKLRDILSPELLNKHNENDQYLSNDIVKEILTAHKQKFLNAKKKEIEDQKKPDDFSLQSLLSQEIEPEYSDMDWAEFKTYQKRERRKQMAEEFPEEFEKEKEKWELYWNDKYGDKLPPAMGKAFVNQKLDAWTNKKISEKIKEREERQRKEKGGANISDEDIESADKPSEEQLQSIELGPEEEFDAEKDAEDIEALQIASGEKELRKGLQRVNPEKFKKTKQKVQQQTWQGQQQGKEYGDEGFAQSINQYKNAMQNIKKKRLKDKIKTKNAMRSGITFGSKYYETFNDV